MALTFPIDEKKLFEIPELAEIVRSSEDGSPDLMLFVAYRFDPKCEEVRRRPTVSEKNDMASKLSGYTPAEDDKSAIQDFTTGYLRLINSMDYEVMVSLEMAHDESMQIIRKPIDMEDDDKTLRASELKQKVIAGLPKIEAEIITRRQKLADGDEEAAKILLETAPARKFRHNTLTGKKEQVE